MFFALNLRVPPSFTCIYGMVHPAFGPQNSHAQKLPCSAIMLHRLITRPMPHTLPSARMLSAQLDVLNPPIFPKSDCITWAIVTPLYGGIIHYFLCAGVGAAVAGVGYDFSSTRYGFFFHAIWIFFSLRLCAEALTRGPGGLQPARDTHSCKETTFECSACSSSSHNKQNSCT